MGFDGIVGSTWRVTYRARHLSGAFDQVQAPLYGSPLHLFLALYGALALVVLRATVSETM